MSAVTPGHLDGLYAGTDDPWHFRTSAYEAGRFDATLRALPRAAYASALEIGCGNGTLAARLARRCAAYVGLDAVEAALSAARRAAPSGRFVRGFVPCDLPPGPRGAGHDLVVLSEILYFLDAPGIGALAAQIDRRWPGADILCVTWRGPSGNALEGEEALALYRAATPRAHRRVARETGYRIDLLAPVAAFRGGIA